MEQDKKIRDNQLTAFESMKVIICQVQLALIEGRHFKDVPKKHYMQYCQVSSESQILKK